MYEYVPWIGQELAGDWLHLPATGAGPETALLLEGREGPRYCVHVRQIDRFLAAHAQTRFSGENAAGDWARMIQETERHGARDATAAAWDALAQNRVLDLGLARELLSLAGVRTNRQIPTQPADIVDQSAALWHQLQLASPPTNGWVAGAARYDPGPLGVGLQVGVSVALQLTSLLGVRFVPGADTELLREAITERDRLYAHVRRSPGLQDLPRGLKKGYPAIHGSNKARFWKWVSDLRAGLADGRGLMLGPFLIADDRLGPAVQYWPGWALQAAAGFDWRDLQWACKLAHELERSRGGLRPDFRVLPTTRATRLDWGPWAHRVFARLDPAHLGHPVRLHFRGLRVFTLARTLGASDPGVAEELLRLGGRLVDDAPGATAEEAIALLTAAGIGPQAVRLHAERDFRVDVNGQRFDELFARWGGLLAGHLQDPSFDQLRGYLSGLGADLRPEELPPDFAPIHAEVVARAIHGGSGRIGLGTRFGTAASTLRQSITRALRAAGRTGFLTTNWMLEGRSAGEYRRVTDGFAVLPSGVAHANLLWVAARWAEVFLAPAEVLKAVVFRLAATGARIIGLEDEAVWVASADPTGEEWRQAADEVLRGLFAHDHCSSTASGIPDG